MSSASFEFDYQIVTGDSGQHLSISQLELAEFLAYPAGISTSASATRFDALTVVFDIEGFTQFCDRADSHLYVGLFLHEFTNWLFNALLDRVSKPRAASETSVAFLKDHLPVFWKPTGDGGFFIWNLHRDKFVGDESVGNIVVHCHEILKKYSTVFVPSVSRKVTAPPVRLRCGIARGDVIALQDGRDYVGSSINLAAHLQGVRSVAFAVCQDGIDPKKCFYGEYSGRYTLKRVPLRSGTEWKNILVDAKEYDALLPEQRKPIEDVLEFTNQS
jgi:hypothetical protein